MSFNSEYMALRKKRKQGGVNADLTEYQEKAPKKMLYSSSDIAPKYEIEKDIAPVTTTKKTTQAATHTAADVIAPVKYDRKWFEKGAFEDGYQFGDLSKTISATGQDLREGLMAGILGIGEKVVDAGAWVGGKLGKLVGLDYEEDIAGFIKKDLYNEREIAKQIVRKTTFGTLANDIATSAMEDGEYNGVTKWIAENVGNYDSGEDSVLGEKSDALVESAGQLVGTIALQSVGVPWVLTSGLTSFGAETESALNQGASYNEAGFSALVSAGAEILTEKMFGGSGLGEKGWINLDNITKNISSKALKVLADYGVDIAAEGAEEVISGYMGAIGQHLSYADEQEINELFTKEDAFESFVGGAVLGGVANVGKVGKSVANETDYRTGLTENDTKVFEHEYKKRIAEAEKEGKVSKNRKAEIYDEVMEDLKDGGITTDTIEEVLGGENYTAYKDASAKHDALVEQKNALAQEYADLVKSGENADRELELSKQIADIHDQIKEADGAAKSAKTALKDYTTKSLSRMKGNRVVEDGVLESYREAERAKNKFEVDTTKKYSAKQKEMLDKIAEKGVINNTRKAHKFWEYATGVAAKRGFDLEVVTTDEIIAMETERLTKKLGSAEAAKAEIEKQFKFKDGKPTVRPNGYEIGGGKIAINAESTDARAFTFGHEITHTLENTKHYAKLQRLLFAYAEAKEGDSFKQRKADTEERYSGVKSANATKEITCDLVGKYVYSDTDFIYNELTKDKNLFQRVWDEVKYLCKMATAGSTEKRDLLRIEREFEKAYREKIKTSEGKDGEKRFSLSPVEAVQPTSDAWQRTLTTDEVKAKFPDLWDVSADESEVRNPTQVSVTVKSYRKIYESLKAEGFDGSILDASSGLGYGTKAGIEEYGFDVDDIEPYPDKSYEPKYKDYSTLDEKYDVVISNAVLNVLPQDQRDALVVKMGELLNDGGRIFINVRGDDVTNASSKVTINEDLMEYYIAKSGSYQKGFTPDELKAYLEDTLGDGFTVEKTRMFGKVSAIVTKQGAAKYSLSDSDGKTLTKEQGDYFKNSKVRDDEGNLKVMYHGTDSEAGFHVFDPSMSDDEMSLFFTDRNDVATSYSGTDETYAPKAFKTVDDANDFFEEMDGAYEVVEQDGEYTLFNDMLILETSSDLGEIYEAWRNHSGYGKGHANYKVYLNLTNPLVVDANGRNWNAVEKEFSQDVYDRYAKLAADEKATLHSLSSWEDISIFRDELRQAAVRYEQGARDDYTANLARAFEKMGNFGVDFYSLFDVATDNFTEDSMRENAVKWLKTRDYAQRAKAGGYDGVIFKNLVDSGSYSNGREGASTVAIAFSPEQVKSVANTNPTADPDIRFSLSDVVEESKDLMAIHNLSEDKLMKALKLGGLPMPSVAIAKAKDGHGEFGNISIILPKDAIDPKASRSNKLYSGDAWTPTYPSIEYKVSSKAQKAVKEKIDNLIPYEAQKALGNISLDYDNLSSDLNRHNGDVYQVYGRNYAMQYAYLVDNGFSEQLPMTEKQLDGFGMFDNSLIVDVVEKLGESKIERLSNEDIYNNDELISELRELANENAKARFAGNGKLLEVLREKPIYTEKNFGFSQADSIIRAAYSYVKNGVEQTIDYKAAREVIEKAVDKDAYKKWLSDLFADIVEKEGIRNNANFFTPSGKRRSFEALHYEHNLENVVKAMREKGTKGLGVIGVGNIFGASTTEFGSIDEMKKSSNRLQKMSQDEYDEIRKGFTDRFFDLSHKLPIHKDSFSATSAAADMLVESVAKYSTRNGIANYLQKESQGWANYSEDIVDELIALVNDIRQLPTGYFEAKPQRAVGFDEVGVFVIPRNADVKLKQELLNRGYAIAEYDPDVEGDRQKVVNSFEEYKFSLSDVGAEPTQFRGHKPLEDVYMPALGQQSVDNSVTDIAPVVQDEPSEENIAPLAGVPISDIDYSPVADYSPVVDGAKEQLDSITDADAPPETEAPYYGENEQVDVDDPFEDRVMKDVSKNRSVKAYMYENPEVKPFFQAEANILLGELERTDKAETFYNGWLKSDMNYDAAKDIPEVYRVPRNTTPDIATLLDDYKMSYSEIEKGLKAIIEDNGAENIAAAKKIEFMLNDRLLNGYISDGYEVEPNQDYINLLTEKQIQEYTEEARQKFFEAADEYAPPEDIAPVVQKTKVPDAKADVENIAPVPTYDTEKKGEIKGQQTLTEAEPPQKTAKVLPSTAEETQTKQSVFTKFRTHFLDDGSVIEDLSLETGNRELQAKHNFMRYSENRAQTHIGEKLKPILDGVERAGKREQFEDYAYHLHNIDRMSLEKNAQETLTRLYAKFGHLKKEQVVAIAAKEITEKTTERTAQTIREAREWLNAAEAKNKPVFGDTVTADVSRAKVKSYEAKNPEFKAIAKEVVEYSAELRQMLVDNGVISQETADLWAKMYPHYMPIRRAGKNGNAVNVLLDTNKTGVNAPIKRATGGNSDIVSLFDTLATRTEQTYKAVAKNRFGVELMHTLDSVVESESAAYEDIMEGIDNHDELLQEGKDGNAPTFTVFDNGKRVTFEISEDIYDALKPTAEGLRYTNKAANAATEVFRGLLTEYNLVFAATNAVKDFQDVLMNSQHARATYAAIPKAIWQMTKRGHYYQEYLQNGGSQNTYFDGQRKIFAEGDKGLKKIIGMPLRAISTINNFIERVPRLAEYIASREMGRSVEVAMLDSARVTTNFAAGGDVTKFLNRNGFTFLNASVQGFNQQVRNIREAKANGLKGWAQLATKVAIAGLPAILLNNLLWDDDEEYEELSDYVKDNYYVIAKTEDGKFVRIPKGRTLAVIQDAFEQIGNALTGDDEVDLANFLDLVISNLAPNNPLENNILAPILQVANNKTWYGEELVPTRLQDLPAAEQFDESTDSISKWLGETFDLSPYKINYLLNQYSGGVGDIFLPMLTPETDGGGVFAPWQDKFTTDGVMNNQNVSDFYDTKDELAKSANSTNATDEDKLRYMYFNAVNSDLSELYQMKREIQNSNYTDAEKSEAVREIQSRIVEITRDALNAKDNVKISGKYATVGDKHYRWYEPSDDSEAEAGWRKITDKQLEKQKEVTSALGISASEYWENKEEYDFAYENPADYGIAKSVGGYDIYQSLMDDLYDIKADKDSSGKTIVGSRKEKVLDYINGMDADYGAKLLIFKSQYNADDTYNYEIIDYLNSREDISFTEMKNILEELGFTVSADGTITW